MAKNTLPHKTKKYKNITQEYLRLVLDYDPETGIVHWKKRRLEDFPGSAAQWINAWNARQAGKIAGHPTTKGYLRIGLGTEGYQYHLHILIWILMTGKKPKNQIDHWDRNKINNRWGNLRDVTNLVNCQNRERPRTNTSGYRGVQFHKATGKWMASICHKYVLHHLGLFDSPEDAYKVYCAAAVRFRGKDALLT